LIRRRKSAYARRAGPFARGGWVAVDVVGVGATLALGVGIGALDVAGVGIGLALATGDGRIAAGDADAPVDEASQRIQAAPRTTTATTNAPIRTHDRLVIRPSVGARPRDGPRRRPGKHDDAMTLSDPERRFLASTRRATLVTIARDGHPRPIPICFVLAPDASVLYTPLDDKPKRADDPRALARVRDIAADPRVSILADRWDEDWTRLAWLRAEGHATLLDPCPEHATAVAALRARYPQYRTHRLDDRPVIRIEIGRVTTWGALEPEP